MRGMVLREGYRADGRGVTDVRPIWSRGAVLPRAHGSVLFTRGETQALAVTTLGGYSGGAGGRVGGVLVVLLYQMKSPLAACAVCQCG